MIKRFVFTVLAVCLFTATALAQTSNSGSLVGTVSGPDGVIPGATVTIIDTQTGRERTAVTNSDGGFNFSGLEFGTYTVKVTAQGFKTHTATNLKIDAGTEYKLTPTLEIGEISETVTVTAGAEVINATNAAMANTISAKDVKELPINGRNPLALLNTMAGVNPLTASINGQRSTVTNYTRDGLNVQDNFIRLGGFVQDRPTVDDTGEFTAVLQNAGAELGSSQTVQLVTPRGGSEYHGALYEFNRNSKFGANSFFGNMNGSARSFLNRNQFGGTISGPTPLPRFGEGGLSLIRNKAFFFFNTEIYRQASSFNGSGTTLLPQARNGTFTYTAACTSTAANSCNTAVTGISPGQQITVNVLSGTGLNLTGANATIFNSAGGTIGIDPIVANRILSALPTSGNVTATQGINFTQTITFPVGSPVVRDAETGRFDVQFNDAHQANFVYKRTFDDNARTDLNYGFRSTTFATQGATTVLYIGAWRWTPNSRFSNEVRGGKQYSNPLFIGNEVPTDFVFANAQGQHTLASIITSPVAAFRTQGRNTWYHNIQDNASYSWGNHSIRFGFNRDRFDIVARNDANTTPLYALSSTGNPNTPGFSTALFPGGISTTDLGRANNLRYLLGGIVGAASVRANLVDLQTGFQLGYPSIQQFVYSIWSGYVQDQWRVSPTLTLNLGLRYDLYSPLNNPQGVYLESRVADGQTPTQAALNPAGVYQALGINAGTPGDFSRADKNNFGPTLSVAWSPNFESGLLSKVFPGQGKTVFRGGYRMSYNNQEYVRTPDNAYGQLVGLGAQNINAFQTFGTNPPTASLRAVFTPRPDAPSFSGVPGNFTAPAVPTLPITYAANNALAAKQGLVWVFDPDIQAPLVHEYNFGIQREIGWKSVIEARYVGSNSNQTWRSIDTNQIDIRSNGFLADFLRARENCRLQALSLNPTNPITSCTNASFNPAIPGSQPLTVFPNLGVFSGAVAAGPGGIGTLTAAGNTSFLGPIQQGTVADLAVTYVINSLAGSVPFLANPNAFVGNVTTNGGLYNYNAMQLEIRRRFADGFSYQVNYTFQKILADSLQDTQQSVDPYLDNANLKLNYARPTFDRTHTINASGNLELPFGKGRRWLNSGGWASKIFGGFQMTNIINISSGAPLTIGDSRGTLNRAARSGLQAATSTLTTDEIKKLVGIFNTPNGIFFINPSVLQVTSSLGPGGVTYDVTKPLPPGITRESLVIRGASPIGTAPFPGQVFFHNPPGSTGNLPMFFLNGPWYFNWNAGFFRNFKFGETKQIQIRAEAFNVLNRPSFSSPGSLDVSSTAFGRITGTSTGARIVQFGFRLDF